MRQSLGWREVDENGEKRDVEASRSLNAWTFKVRYHRRDLWTTVDRPTLRHWEDLVDQLQRKYRRRRCAWRDVEEATEMLEKARRDA